MEETTSGSSTGAGVGCHNVPAKRKFFQWAVKWFYANISENIEDKPDAPTLACLLQSMGFQLREFEKIGDGGNVDNRDSTKNRVTVTIDCETSGMRARLEMNDVKCQCPNSEDAEDASFWSVSGTGPAATVQTINKIEESGSNILPTVSKDTRKVLNDVLYRLIGIIGDKTIDANQNDRTGSNIDLNRVGSTMNIMEIVNKSVANETMNFVRSRTQPEIVISGFRRYNMAARSLVKESISGVPGLASKTWGDLDCGSIDGDNPRPSPPKIASSPVVLGQLCSSLGQISLQSEEEASNLAEHVIRAHKCLEKAVEIIIGRRSPISIDSSINERPTLSKPRATVENTTGSGNKRRTTSGKTPRSSPNENSISRPGSSCSSSSQILSTPGTCASSASATSGGRRSLSYASRSPITTRRSVGSTLSTTPLSAFGSVNTIKRGNSTTAAPSNLTASAESKIPNRCKSFGALTAPQPMKLAVARARNAANATKKNANTPISAIPTNQTESRTSNKRRGSPDGKINDGFGMRRSASSIGATSGNNMAAACDANDANVKIGGTKGIATRKSIGNPKFGFSNKKI